MDQIRNWSIYKITNPAGHVYVGKTCNLKKRKSHYQQLECKSQPILYRSFLKYGFKSHSFEVIDSFASSISYCSGKEIFWIRTYMSYSKVFPEMNGMNLTIGGGGALGRIVSLEQREKMRDIGKMLRHTEEAKRKIGEAAKGNKFSLGSKHSEEWKSNMSKRLQGHTFNKGRKPSEETRQKMRSVKIKNGTSRESLDKMVAWNVANKGKKVIQYDLLENLLNEYPTIRDAARKTDNTIRNVRLVLKGTFKQINGYVFKLKKP